MAIYHKILKLIPKGKMSKLIIVSVNNTGDFWAQGCNRNSTPKISTYNSWRDLDTSNLSEPMTVFYEPYTGGPVTALADVRKNDIIVASGNNLVSLIKIAKDSDF